MKDPNMKYTDYTPNRTTRQIRADMELIQSMRPIGMNRKRSTHQVHIYAIIACTVAAIAIIIFAKA